MTNFFKNLVINNMINNNYIKKVEITDLLLPNKNILKERDSNTSYLELSKDKIKDPLIYIYNTFQTQSYYSPYIYDYSLKPNVMIASYIFKEELLKYNINSIVETENLKEYMENNNIKSIETYKASRYFLSNSISKYKTIKYYIDIQRSNSNIEKTLYKENDTKYAKIQFIIGKNNKNYKDNLVLINKITKYILQDKPGILNEIEYISGNFIDGVFNQDLNKNVMLINVGGVENKIEEVNNTMKYLSSVFGFLEGYNNGKEEK